MLLKLLYVIYTLDRESKNKITRSFILNEVKSRKLPNVNTRKRYVKTEVAAKRKYT